MDKDKIILELQKEIRELRAELKSMAEKMRLILSQQLQKDSRNSHNPPSQDRKNHKSLRKKSTRKTGGQDGHKGNTLKMSEHPNKCIELKSNYCNKCGNDLREKIHFINSRRQVVDIPPISPIYTEYQQFACKCGCGHKQKSPFPTNVNAPIQYGDSIVALVSYLNVYQYVPYQRLKYLLTDLFSIPISEGTIDNLVNKTAKKAKPIYTSILEHLEQSQYIGSDETGAKVNGNKWWIWVWQNAKNTYLKASNTRGFAAIEEVFPNGLPNVIIGSDRWAAQLKIKSKGKQLCYPHLLRDIVFLQESEKNVWADHFDVLLKEVLKLRKQAEIRNKEWSQKESKIVKLQDRLACLFIRNICKEKYPKTNAFQRSMVKYKNYLFTCLFDLNVPPDNNASERAIRNVKVKQKISGQFKSGQNTFCVIRSLIDTFNKRNLNILEYLGKIQSLTT